MTVRVRDIRPSGWDNYYVKYVTLIDLTAAFGAGKEPTLAEMDRLMARFPNSWFDGVKPIQTIETLYQEKASKAQEAWITPTLVNAWTIYTAIATRVSYRKNELGKVELRGFVGSGTAGTVAFTLPVGYRPIQTVVIPTVSGGRVTVYANGNVEITAFTTYCSLDAVSFNLD